MDFRREHGSDQMLAAGARARIGSTVIDLVNRDAMRAQVRAGAIPERQWRQALRMLADEAHAEGVAPEQLLGEVKQALAILCDFCGVPHGHMRTEFSSRVVSLCSEEYFAARGADRIGN